MNARAKGKEPGMKKPRPRSKGRNTFPDQLRSRFAARIKQRQRQVGRMKPRDPRRELSRIGIKIAEGMLDYRPNARVTDSLFECVCERITTAAQVIYNKKLNPEQQDAACLGASTMLSTCMVQFVAPALFG